MTLYTCNICFDESLDPHHECFRYLSGQLDGDVCYFEEMKEEWKEPQEHSQEDDYHPINDLGADDY